MTIEYVIGVDIGTTAHKVIIVDAKGTIVCEGSQLLKPVRSPFQGWAEQDTSDWYEKITSTTKEVIEQANIPPEQIGALGIANNGRGVILVDKDGKVLRPVILWLDTRTILDKTERMKWIRENEPEIYAETYKMIGPQAWLNYKLTGTWRDSSSSAFADELIDSETWDWDEKLVIESKIPSDMLPELILPGEVLGYITKNAAKNFGLPYELPIIAGGRDKQLGSLAAGCIEPDKMMLSLGTAVTIGTTSDRILDEPIFSQKSGIPFHYDSEMGFGGGFWTIRWFIEQFRENLSVESSASYEELEKGAKDVIPCSEGLVVLPHWWGGQWFRLPFPNWEKGAILGWTARHTIHHFYRAIIEGLLHEVRTYKEQMEQIIKSKFTDIRVIGGGSKSDFVLQIAADILGSDVSRIHTSSAEALGAAIVAAKGCGMYNSIEEAIQNMSRVIQTFKPIKKNQKIYDEFHKKVYVSLDKVIGTVNQNLFSIVEKTEELFRK